ncbi:MAG: nucleotide exchange factor GrpE [Alphaproteobacteria bacterium]|nr:nucleotide exchange factor GrpE [Alphaproteobacteria bacterium]
MTIPDENEKPAEGEMPEPPATENEAQTGDPTPAAETPTEEVAEAALARELAETKDKLLRTLAEMENLRARTKREEEQARKFAIADFARAILSVADNLHRAIENTPDLAGVSDEALKALIEGVAITERDLLATLDRYNIQKIDPMGEKFNHDFHQAMFEVETAKAPPGTVVEVMQIGYTLNDRLLRPAMVGVAKAATGGKEGDGAPHVDTEA